MVRVQVISSGLAVSSDHVRADDVEVYADTRRSGYMSNSILAPAQITSVLIWSILCVRSVETYMHAANALEAKGRPRGILMPARVRAEWACPEKVE